MRACSYISSLLPDENMVLLIRMDAEPMAIEAFRFEQLIQVFHQERVVYWSCQLNVADMSWAEIGVEPTSRTTRDNKRGLEYLEAWSKGEMPIALS